MDKVREKGNDSMILSAIIIILLIFGAITGYKRGFILQLGGLLSLVLGVIFAMFYGQTAANWATEMLTKYAHMQFSVPERYFTNIVVFFVLFTLASGVFQGIWRSLNNLTRLPFLHIGNSILGIFAGIAVQYLLIFVVLNLFLATSSNWVQQQYNDSTVAQRIVKIDRGTENL